MSLRIVIAAVVALGLAAAAWFYRGSPTLAGVSHAVGVPTDSATPETAATLKAAGVHKCVGGRPHELRRRHGLPRGHARGRGQWRYGDGHVVPEAGAGTRCARVVGVRRADRQADRS